MEEWAAVVSEVVLVAEALAPGFIEPSFGQATEGRGVGKHLLCGLRDCQDATVPACSCASLQRFDSSAIAGRTVTEVVPIDRFFVQLNTCDTGPDLARKVRGGIAVAFLSIEMPFAELTVVRFLNVFSTWHHHSVVTWWSRLSRSQSCPCWRVWGPGKPKLGHAYTVCIGSHIHCSIFL